MKKFAALLLLVSLVAAGLYFSGNLPLDLGLALPVSAQAGQPTSDPVTAALGILDQMRITGKKDKAAFNALFLNTDQATIGEYRAYDWSYSAPGRHERTAHTLVARQGQYAYVSLVFYSVSGRHPNTNMRSDSIGLPLVYEGGRWFIDSGAKAQEVLNPLMMARYPEGLVKAQDARRNATFFGGGNFMYLDMGQVFQDCSNVELKLAWQNPDGSVTLGLWIANGTNKNINYGNAKISLKDKKLGTILNLTGVAVDEIVLAQSSRLVEITIPASQVKTGTRAWGQVENKVNINFR